MLLWLVVVVIGLLVTTGTLKMKCLTTRKMRRLGFFCVYNFHGCNRILSN